MADRLTEEKSDRTTRKLPHPNRAHLPMVSIRGVRHIPSPKPSPEHETDLKRIFDADHFGGLLSISEIPPHPMFQSTGTLKFLQLHSAA